MSEAYKEAGVDLALGNDLSKMLYEASRQTWPNRSGKYGEIRAVDDFFSGFRSWSIKPLLEIPNPSGIEFDQDADGIGTKVEVSQRTASYNTAAYDLLAMACDDPAARGFEPVIVTTVLDTNKLDSHMRPAMQQLANGLIEAADLAKVAIKGGETAELGDAVGGYDDSKDVLQYNWSATVHAVGHRDRLLNGRDIQPGDALVALQEKGFRSNGLSLVRRALTKEYGSYWHKALLGTQQRLGELVLQPSVIYSAALVDMIGGYDLRRQPRAPVHGVAHITGGGIPEKVGRLLQPSGYGADIENPYQPTELMKIIQKTEDITDEEMYRVINMGQGAIVITPEPNQVLDVAKRHNIGAKEVGAVIDQPEIRLRSAGAKTPGKNLVYAVS